MRIAPSLAVVIVFCGGLAAAWTAAPAAGAPIPSDALLQKLQPQGSVSDFAGILNPGERAALDARAAELRRKTGAQFAVVILKSLEGTLSRLLLVAEQYPDLKASQNFRDLQYELAGTENRISVERQRYNEAVRAYNTALRQFPGSLVAGIRGFSADATYFEAAAPAKQAPKVDFDAEK